jgi:hypothetical protein
MELRVIDEGRRKGISESFPAFLPSSFLNHGIKSF